MLDRVSKFFQHKLVLTSLCCLLGLIYLSTLPEPLFPSEASVQILDDEDELIHAYLNKIDHYQFPLSSDTLPYKLAQAIISFEDQQFYSHFGVDPLAIARAFWSNIRSDEIISGASTITMQVARIMQPKPRTYWNKFIEILQALRLEIRFSKAEILQMYVNHAPYGRNFIGVETAAYFYFKKKLLHLTWAEAALLAVLPNAPGLLNPTKNQSLLLKKRNKLLQILSTNGLLSPSELALSLKEHLPTGIFPVDKIAPHAAQQLIQTSSEKLIRSTLSSSIQSRVTELVRDYSHELNQLGIQHVAVLVAETKTGQVKAYVGSPKFFDLENQGMVDGVQAMRSSGSILKPFLYAMAMEDGILLPETVLSDIPTYYNGFAPRNADKRFNGYASTRQALIKSLNVPPVRVLYQYGLDQFYMRMKQLGVRSFFRDAENYGLPIILGGAEVNVWDMVQAYSTLGNLGKETRLSLVRSAQPQTQQFQAITAFQILDILRDVKRPDAEFFWDQFDSTHPLAWKTGTSYGLKDGWAMGVSPEWTIGVWAGNFNGDGNPNLSGAKSAGPLLFRIFNRLNKSEQSRWFALPEKRKAMTVCAVSGFQKTPLCPSAHIVFSPETKTPLALCSWHQRVYLNKSKSKQVCSLCWDTNHVSDVRLVIPQPIAYQLRKNGQRNVALPPHKQNCPSVSNSHMQFIYPEHGAVLALPRDMNGKTMPLIAKISHNVNNVQLYWYINESFAGQSTSSDFPLLLSAGEHTLSVVDKSGAKISRKITVLESKN